MEETVQPRSLKLTFRCLNTSATENLSSADVVENNIAENEENNPSSENSQYQLVIYNPAANSHEVENDPDPVHYQTPSFSRVHPFSDKRQRVLPAVGAFTVQCANCYKWRLIPTKEKYEEIREYITVQPFFCETAREWKPDISCDDPPDITQDGSLLWAIDKPNIAQPPPGWQRLMRIRGEGGRKFADVYYVAPTGKTLRSKVEIQRYLDEHSQYVENGVTLSQFSFLTPKPLQENYIRKRPACSPAAARQVNRNYSDHHGTQGSFDPSPVYLPTAWGSPDVETDLQLNAPVISTNYSETSSWNPYKFQTAMKKKRSAKRRRPDVETHLQLNAPVISPNYSETSGWNPYQIQSAKKKKRSAKRRRSDVETDLQLNVPVISTNYSETSGWNPY